MQLHHHDHQKRSFTPAHSGGHSATRWICAMTDDVAARVRVRGLLARKGSHGPTARIGVNLAPPPCLNRSTELNKQVETLSSLVSQRTLSCPAPGRLRDAHACRTSAVHRCCDCSEEDLESVAGMCLACIESNKAASQARCTSLRHCPATSRSAAVAAAAAVGGLRGGGGTSSKVSGGVGHLEFEAGRSRASDGRDLWNAASRGDMSEVRRLVLSGVNMMWVDKRQWSCLHIAAQNGHFAIVKFLSATGGPELLMKIEETQASCLYIAAQNGHFETAGLLAEMGGQELLMKTEEDQWSCLHVAAKNGHFETAGLLAEMGGKELLMKTNKNQASCLYIAAQNGHFETAKLLAEMGGKELLMKTNKNQASCLYIAAQNGHFETAGLLAKMGGKELLMKTNKNQASCLYIAAKNGHSETAKLLAEMGGKELLMKTDKRQWSCLLVAAQNGHFETAKLLAEMGGQELLMKTDGEQWSCLHVAVWKGHFETAKLLAEMGGLKLLMKTTEGGRRALDVAKEYGHQKIIEMLTEASCLWRAAQNGHFETAKLLAEMGGLELLMKIDKDGRRALDVAKQYGHQKIVEMLTEEEHKHEAELLEHERILLQAEEKAEEFRRELRSAAMRGSKSTVEVEERARREVAESAQQVEEWRGREAELKRREEELLRREEAPGVEMIDFRELELERQPMAYGSFKEVYRATWRRPDQQGEGERVAVLVMRMGGSLLKEVAVMKMLGRHPHLCTMLGTTVKPPSGSQGIVMEFAEMGSLDSVLHQISESGAERPTDAVLITIVDQVCEGMRVLCERKIIHRDLAARNCLVFGFHHTMRRHICIKVTDYGLAMDASGGTVITTNSSHAANPIRWMAPEAIKSRMHSLQSDVYSFGVLIWEVFTLCDMPFWNITDDAELAKKIVMEGARPERPDECPDAVYAIMQNCWKHNKTERPTFAQLKFDLQDALIAVEGRAHASTEDSDENLCVVCLERPATHALLPCGHRCACEEDAMLLHDCPICRSWVINRNRIY